MIQTNSAGSDNNGENKAKSQIYAIICVALVIIVVAAIFIVDKINEDNKKNEQARQISENFSGTLDSNYKEATDIKANLNLNAVGTYKSFGYSNEATIELHEDGTITVIPGGEKGWWTSSSKDGIELVSILFQNSSEPDIYQVYGSRLIDTQSVYFGDVKIGESFDSALTMGNMTITLDKSGKASGRYKETVTQDGVEFPYTEAFSGRYTVDGEHITLTLNGDEARFLMFDYEDSKLKDGMASLYYEKIG